MEWMPERGLPGLGWFGFLVFPNSGRPATRLN